MGLLDKILSYFEINTYRGICRAMINSYNKVKQRNPNASQRELYALAFSLRPTWRRKEPSSFIFTKGQKELIIKDTDKFEDLVRNIIILETLPDFAPNDLMVTYLTKISVVILEEFKEFKE